jgi:hypothetical protein
MTAGLESTDQALQKNRRRASKPEIRSEPDDHAIGTGSIRPSLGASCGPFATLLEPQSEQAGTENLAGNDDQCSLMADLQTLGAANNVARREIK